MEAQEVKGVDIDRVHAKRGGFKKSYARVSANPSVRGASEHPVAGGGNRRGLPPAPIRRRDDEHQQQKALIVWCRLVEEREPRLKLLYAIPNGRLRSKAEAAKLKAEGVRAGVPDLCLPVSCDAVFVALYIEMKAPKGRLSDVQEMYITRLREERNRVVTARSWTEAARGICEYLDRPDLAAGLDGGSER